MANDITGEDRGDGIDRRGFLKCMAWAGTGLLWSLAGGVAQSRTLDQRLGGGLAPAGTGFSFVQLSDSHIGFDKAANHDVVGTFEAAVARIRALPAPPDLVLHTGDITHLSKPQEFDTVAQILSGARMPRVFAVPGEHDVLADGGATYREHYGAGATGGGWYSFTHKGVHFVGLVNVANLGPGGLGRLGGAQLEWLAKDLERLSASTPIVIFAHLPLWTVYADWGWGTDDSAQALAHLKRFGSATVLNGHIHQIMQKVEGSVTFHTAMSTAFPQPQPGKAPSPGPMTVPAGQLRTLLGVTDVRCSGGRGPLAVTDEPLQAAAALPATQVGITNFRFAPPALAVRTGTTVTWTNHDDSPHTVVSADGRFASPVLDTDDRFAHAFARPGAYPYFCSIHPHMKGSVTVS